MTPDLNAYQDWLAGAITTLTALRAVYGDLVEDERQLRDAELLVAKLESRRARHMTELRLMLGARPGHVRAHEAQEARDD